MHRRTIVNLCGIALGWAVLWTVLHFFKPSTFPWVGVPAGLLIVAPLLVLYWIELRTSGKRGQKSEKRKQ